MVCEYHKECLFFSNKMQVNEIIGKMHKKKYCYLNKNKCARYKIAKTIGEKLVPSNIYPDMNEKASKMIKMYSKK